MNINQIKKHLNGLVRLWRTRACGRPGINWVRMLRMVH